MPVVTKNQLTHTILADAFADFMIDRHSRQMSPRTIQLYRAELTPFLDRLRYQGVEVAESITPDHIRSHLLELAEHRNPGGVHIRYRAIKTFLRWAWEEFELETRNPITRVAPPKLSNAPLPGVPIETIAQMVSACVSGMAVRDKAILLCLLDTAARRAEFLALNWSDVNLISGDVLIRSGKGGKSRTVYLGKRSLKALRAWRRVAPKCEAIWATTTGERLSYSGIREVIRRRAADAGVNEPGLHDFRRACLLGMLRNGADAVSVSRYAGHADLRVTMRYLAQTDDDLHLAHAKASPVDNAGL